MHSRNFISTINDTETNVLVPMADMLNTNNPQNTAWYYDQLREGFVIEASRDIKSGEQLYDWYGAKCNSDFLKNYGFILLDGEGLNEKNQVTLKSVLDPEDPFYLAKWEVFMQDSDFS